MMVAVDTLERAALQALRPPPRLKLSEWADEKFYLSAESAADPGRWRTLPYQREPMDAITDPRVEQVTFMKSARVGFTKILNAAVGYYMEQDPCSVMIVQPTIEDAQGYSKEEIAPMLRDCPALQGLVSDAKSRDSDNTILHKTFRGGSAVPGRREQPARVSPRVAPGRRVRRGRRVSAQRRRRRRPDQTRHPPNGVLLEQEDHRREHAAPRRPESHRAIVPGRRPASLLRALHAMRAHGLPRVSTRGDRRRRAGWALHALAERAIRKRRTSSAGVRRHHRARGQARHHRGGRMAATRGRSVGHASFHVWAAYSYSPNASWGQLAAEFLEANAAGPDQLKTFVNTVLGETWQERGDAPEWERLYQRREAYPIGECPRGVLFLTAGVDVQKNRFVYEVVGWGRGKTSWSVDYGIIEGDTSDVSDKGPWPAAGRRCSSAGTGRTRAPSVDRATGDRLRVQHANRLQLGASKPLTQVIAVKGVDSGKEFDLRAVDGRRVSAEAKN
jgi:hypothetical protein